MQKAVRIFNRLQTGTFILVVITCVLLGVRLYNSFEASFETAFVGNLASILLIFGLLLSVIMFLVGIVDLVQSTRQKNLQATFIAKQMLLNGILWLLLYLGFFSIVIFALSSFMVPSGGTLPVIE